MSAEPGAGASEKTFVETTTHSLALSFVTSSTSSMVVRESLVGTVYAGVGAPVHFVAFAARASSALSSYMFVGS